MSSESRCQSPPAERLALLKATTIVAEPSRAKKDSDDIKRLMKAADLSRLSPGERALVEGAISATRRNAFLAEPVEHHGPVAGGTRPYPGFHTAEDMDTTAPYAQMKAVDEVDVPACDVCEDDGCDECAREITIPDYPVIVGVDMNGLDPEPDYDAIVLAMDALRIAAGEALDESRMGGDPMRWLDTIDSESRDYPGRVDEALFERFAHCVAQPAMCLMRIMEGQEPEEVDRRLEAIVEGGEEAERLAMNLIGQFRYTQDVGTDRIVSVHYMKPFWPHEVFDGFEDDMQEALVEAGWDTVCKDDIDAFDPSYALAYERVAPAGARVEYHGTSYRNLLLAAPELVKSLPQPPKPYAPEGV
jgi:hypothetical protein